MADNSTLPATGEIVRDIEKGAAKTQVMLLDIGGAGTEVLADANHPIPVAARDCVALLDTNISATGPGASLDTAGFAAISVQISGVWQGSGYFEVSNAGGTAWDSILVFSRDSLSLQDIVNQNGMFTIRPSGRYVRFVFTSLTGTATINAQGRSAEGISAADILSLAMDQANNAPMFVAPLGPAGRTFAQDQATGAALQVPVANRYTGVLTAVNQVFEFDTLGMTSVVGYYNQTGTQTVTIEGLFPTGWVAIPAVPQGSATSSATASTGLFAMQTCGASRVRYRCTAWTSGYATILAVASPFFQRTPQDLISAAIVGTVPAGTNAIGDVGIQYRASITGAAVPASVISPAATTVTQVKAAAGRLLSWTLQNSAAAVRSVKVFFLPSASVTMGTTSASFEIDLPANGFATFSCEGGVAPAGGTGISWAVTAAKGLLDNTATGLAANDVTGVITYA